MVLTFGSVVDTTPCYYREMKQRQDFFSADLLRNVYRALLGLLVRLLARFYHPRAIDFREVITRLVK